MVFAAQHSALAGRVSAFLNGDDIQAPLVFLEKLLPADAQIYIVGGALRDRAIHECHGSGPVTKDIDLFIGNLPDNYNLLSPMVSERCSPTDLGGIRWLPGDSRYAFDLSRLQDFVIFRKYHIEPSLKNLLASVDFTFNAIVYDRQSATLHETGCLQDIGRRILDFHTTMFYNRNTIAYRALLLRFKTGFILSEDVFEFLKSNVDVQVLTFVNNLLSVKLSADRAKTVLQDYVRISSFKDYRSYRLGADEAMR